MSCIDTRQSIDSLQQSDWIAYFISQLQLASKSPLPLFLSCSPTSIFAPASLDRALLIAKAMQCSQLLLSGVKPSQKVFLKRRASRQQRAAGAMQPRAVLEINKPATSTNGSSTHDVAADIVAAEKYKVTGAPSGPSKLYQGGEQFAEAIGALLRCSLPSPRKPH